MASHGGVGVMPTTAANVTSQEQRSRMESGVTGNLQGTATGLKSG